MKLSQFKIGDIILKEESPGRKLFGPVEFLGYENKLLFCIPVQLPESFFRETQFEEGVRAIRVLGRSVHILKMNEEDDDWFKFPVKTLGKIKAYIAIKYPEPAEVEEAPEADQGVPLVEGEQDIQDSDLEPSPALSRPNSRTRRTAHPEPPGPPGLPDSGLSTDRSAGFVG